MVLKLLKRYHTHARSHVYVAGVMLSARGHVREASYQCITRAIMYFVLDNVAFAHSYTIYAHSNVIYAHGSYFPLSVIYLNVFIEHRHINKCTAIYLLL